MRIGVNWLSPHTLPIVKTLISEGHADFCEIMVDNVIHLSPEQIKAALPDIPIALHIVASRFLEKSEQELKQMAQHLRPWIKELEPIYVSDHLAQFTNADDMRLPLVRELDYAENYTHIKNRINMWQELLGIQLLIENHASMSAKGNQQAHMYESLLRDTNTELLFDFSNAYIAEHNRVLNTNAWDRLIKHTHHFHVAGFRIDAETTLALDTHDVPIADGVYALMQSKLSYAANKTIVIECVESTDITDWKNEIQRFKQQVLAC